MKRINVFFQSLVIIIACGVFVACGDDDNNESSYNDKLVGTWQAIVEEEMLTINGEVKYHDLDENVVNGWILILKENGTFLSEFEESGEIAIDGEGTWKSNDNISNLTLLFKEEEGIDEEEGDILKYDVVFQDNKMILTSRESYNENGYIYEEYERRVLIKK